jgi:hypothetical protein
MRVAEGFEESLAAKFTVLFPIWTSGSGVC